MRQDRVYVEAAKIAQFAFSDLTLEQIDVEVRKATLNAADPSLSLNQRMVAQAVIDVGRGIITRYYNTGLGRHKRG